MCRIVALMDLRFQGFWFIDSFCTLCPLKDIAAQPETGVDVTDNNIIDGFCLFSNAMSYE